MDTRRKGYLFFLCIGLITSSILSLFVTWVKSRFSINPDGVLSGTGVPDEMSATFVSFLSGQTFSVTGTSGRISSLGFPIPYWIATILVVTSSVMILMNIYKLGDFPVLMLMSFYGVATMIIVVQRQRSP